VPALNVPTSADRGTQALWLQTQNRKLKELAAKNELGQSLVLGETPMEPVLQWREQIILDHDVTAGIANAATATAFSELADRLTEKAIWDSP